MQNSFLIWGYYGYKNTGDEFMLSVLNCYLKKIFPESTIKVISSNPVFTANFHQLESIYNRLAVKSGIVPFICKRILDFKAILKCNVFIFGGGTFLFNPDGINTKSLIVNLINIIFARIMGKKIFFIGAGAENLKTKKDKLIIKLMFQFVHKAFIRDSDSIKLLKAIGVNKNKLILSSDLAYLLNTKPKTAVKNCRKSAAICPFAYFKNLEKNDLKHHKLVASFRRLVEKLLSLNYEVHLIPFQDDKTVSDYLFNKEIYEKLKDKNGVILHNYHADFVKTLDTVKTMDIVFGMRYHSIVFSTINEVPFVAIECTQKIKTLANAVGIEDAMLSLEEFLNNPEKAGFTAETLINNEKIKTKLKNFRREQRTLSKKNFEELEYLVNS
jgi:polysaccharide pyruvyl transferase CsaB